MASRRQSRHRAIQILYQSDIRGLPVEEAIASFYDSLYSEENPEQPGRDEFMENLVKGTSARTPSIDPHIERHSEHWRLKRMPAVDRNIMRMAIFELMSAELPPPVIIDEALDLARRFSGDESVSFINGVLDAVRKELAPPSHSASFPDTKS
ncbi:MAG: transcription antitermination factor NusB [Bryobacteraceae bacterium]